MRSSFPQSMLVFYRVEEKLSRKLGIHIASKSPGRVLESRQYPLLTPGNDLHLHVSSDLQNEPCCTAGSTGLDACLSVCLDDDLLSMNQTPEE